MSDGGTLPTEVLSRALEANPRDYRVRINLALLFGQRGESRRGLRLLADLSREYPRSALVHYNLGAAVLASGDAGVARNHLRSALAFEPELTGARLALARAHLQLGAFDAAQAELERALGHNPWLAGAHHLLGLVMARKGKHRRAVTHHDEAIRRQPYRADFHFSRALSLQLAAEASDDDAAMQQRIAKAYQAALELEPKQPRALYGLGLVRAKQGRFERAADLYLEALELAPDYALAAYRLGVALRATGQTAAAVGALCLALRLKPRLGSARRELREVAGDDACGG